MEIPFKLDHLSYSSVMAWHQCPRSWWLHYVRGYSTPPNGAYAFGTAMHRAIQNSLVDGGISQKSADLFHKDLEVASLEAMYPMPSKEFADLTALGRALLLEPNVQLLLNSVRISSQEQVERRLEFMVPGVPIPIVGYIDLLDDFGYPYDIKTSKWDWDEGKADAEVQPDFYLTALDANNIPGHGGKFSHIIVIKNIHSPNAYFMDTVRTNWKEKTYDLVQSMWNGVMREDYLDPSHRAACTGCKFDGLCTSTTIHPRPSVESLQKPSE